MGEISELLKKYNIHADKRLSQNFLVDGNVIKRIIDAADLNKKTAVIEIGSGVGSLTAELLKAAGKVVAVELDARLCRVLREEYGEYISQGVLSVVNADILKTDINSIVSKEIETGKAVKVCANLPYHITTPVTMGLLEDTNGIESLTLMMQKEVADRILSQPGTKDYGSITPVVNYYADARLVTNVPPNCFIPRPGVYSAVVSFSILPQKRVSPKDEALMLSIIKASFGQRRKTIMNALSNQLLPSLGISKEQLLESFFDENIVNYGITPSTRGETMGLSQFAALSDAIHIRMKREL